MKVLCDAVPFGFGPVGKLLAIAPHLPSDWSLSLLSSGTSYKLALRSSFKSVIACDTEDWNDLEQRRGEFQAADLFLNVMNPVSVKYAALLGVPTVVVDSLYWMWNDVPSAVMDVRAYYVQNFTGVLGQIDRIRPRNVHMVGPIVDPRFVSKVRKNQLLIHVGGIWSRLVTAGARPPYPALVGTLLTKALKTHEFDRVIVAGNEDALKMSAAQWTIPRSSLVTLPHERFLKELARSKLALLSPGLTATYEAFCYGTPVVFLPPQNLSQFCILKSLRQSRAAEFSIHWTDFYPEMDIELPIPEPEGVRRVLSCISRFRDDEKANLLAAEYVAKALRREEWTATSLCQKRFFDSLGGNGALAIAAHLSQTATGC